MTLLKNVSNAGWYVFLGLVIVAVIAAVFAFDAPDGDHLPGEEQAEQALTPAEPCGSSEAKSVARASTLARELPIDHRGLHLPGEVIWSIPQAVVAGAHVDIAAILDRADLSFLPGESEETSPGDVVVTVLQNVKVLERSEDGGITLEVVPDEAELLLLLALKGSLALTLRNPDDLSTVPPVRQSLRRVLEEVEIVLDAREERRMGTYRICPPGEFHRNGKCTPQLDIIR